MFIYFIIINETFFNRVLEQFNFFDSFHYIQLDDQGPKRIIASADYCKLFLIMIGVAIPRDHVPKQQVDNSNLLLLQLQVGKLEFVFFCDQKVIPPHCFIWSQRISKSVRNTKSDQLVYLDTNSIFKFKCVLRGIINKMNADDITLKI